MSGFFPPTTEMFPVADKERPAGAFFTDFTWQNPGRLDYTEIICRLSELKIGGRYLVNTFRDALQVEGPDGDIIKTSPHFFQCMATLWSSSPERLEFVDEDSQTVFEVPLFYKGQFEGCFPNSWAGLSPSKSYAYTIQAAS